MCPTAVLKGGAVIGSDLNAALKRALQTATFAATYVKGATFQADYMGVVVNTTSGNPQVASSVTYAVESSDFSWPELATTQDLCGPTPDCSALVSPCPDGRYNDGAVCAICPAGHECADDALTVCAAGSVAPYAGTAACALCDLDTYRSTAGGSYCEPCPDNAYAHFRGSTGCLACYFGMPKVVAGEIDGVAAFDVMPNEQPRPGKRTLPLLTHAPSPRHRARHQPAPADPRSPSAPLQATASPRCLLPAACTPARWSTPSTAAIPPAKPPTAA